MDKSTILVELGFGCYGISDSDREYFLENYILTLPVAMYIDKEIDDE